MAWVRPRQQLRGPRLILLFRAGLNGPARGTHKLVRSEHGMARGAMGHAWPDTSTWVMLGLSFQTAGQPDPAR
jgi:hypothetical protein